MRLLAVIDGAILEFELQRYTVVRFRGGIEVTVAWKFFPIVAQLIEAASAELGGHWRPLVGWRGDYSGRSNPKQVLEFSTLIEAFPSEKAVRDYLAEYVR